MQTYLEMRTELQKRLVSADNSTLYDTTRLQTLIKDAHMWATGLFNWSEFQRTMSTTANGTDYYFDYPTNYRTDSLVRLFVDDIPYDKKNFDDWKEHKRDNPDEKEANIFADHGRQFFIFKTPVSGAVVDVVGQIQAVQLSVDGDKTVFSLSDETGNEAIVKKAFSVAILRIEDTLASKEEKDAIGILANIFKKQKDAQSTEQSMKSMLDVPDFFAGRQAPAIGNFSKRA